MDGREAQHISVGVWLSILVWACGPAYSCGHVAPAY